MGVIKRQGIKHSVVRYFGLAIGTINVLYFYPLFLGDEKLGIINFIIPTAILAHTFIMLGANGVAVKFFPMLKEEELQDNFLTFLLLWVLLGSTLFVGTLWLVKPLILDYSEKSVKLLLYLPYILSIGFAAAIQNVLKKYISNFGRIVIPTLFDQLYKVVLPVLACLYFFEFIIFR